MQSKFKYMHLDRSRHTDSDPFSSLISYLGKKVYFILWTHADMDPFKVDQRKYMSSNF
jgi:hypothetical protein